MAHDHFSGTGEISLVPGTLRGFRYWSFPSHGHTLHAAVMSYQYERGWNKAMCLVTEEIHPMPGRQCRCGFYAFSGVPTVIQRFQYAGHLDFAGRLAGIVEAKGRVVLGTLGFRAEQVRILALCGYITEQKKRIADYYGVPLFETQRDMLAEFPLGDVSALLGGDACQSRTTPDMKSL